MKTTWKYVGLDVHKETIAIAVFAQTGNEPEAEFEIPNDSAKIQRVFKKWPVGSLKVCYEAGPCGFVLYRQLQQMGINVRIVAPGKISRPAADRIKTDRRDARICWGECCAAACLLQFMYLRKRMNRFAIFCGLGMTCVQI